MAIIPDIRQVIDAVYTKLNADGTLTGLASLVSGPNVKGDITLPYVHIRPVQGLTDISTKNSYGWEYDLQIMIVSNDMESDVEMETLIDLVVQDLHRNTLSLSTDNHILTRLTGLTPAVTSNDLNGNILSFTITIVD
jgi:hypothetical protein